SPGSLADVKVGLDANGNMLALKSDWFTPHEHDVRTIGAMLAGLPEVTPQPGWVFPSVFTVWPYDKVGSVLEQNFFSPNLAATSPYGGLRGNIMRTPRHRQPNFAIEAMINEAAAAAGADPIEFR